MVSVFTLEDPRVRELQREIHPAWVKTGGQKVSGSEDNRKDCLLFKVLSMLTFGGLIF